MSQNLRRLARLLLLLLTLKGSLGSSAGAHTLRYDLTAWHVEGSGQPQFLALGYLDGELFLRYNGDSRTAEPCGLGMKGPVGAETWARETEELQEKEQQLRTMLAEVTGHHRHHGGPLSLQATLGCGLQGELSTGGSWHLGYNGQDFLTFDLETSSWKVAEPSARTAEILRKMHGVPKAELVKTFLYESCPAQLRRHLASMRNQLQDTGPPMVNVSHQNYPVDRISMTCRAFHLYPPITTLTWLRDGEPVQQPTSGPGALLPSGDGTYQTWVSIGILPGEEPRIACHVRHGSHNTTVPAVSEHQAKNTGGITNTAAALHVSVLPAMFVLLIYFISRLLVS